MMNSKEGDSLSGFVPHQESLLEVLMRRDGVTREEGLQLISEARHMVYEEEEDAEDVLKRELNLGPEYISDLL